MKNARERVIDALLTQHLSEHTESMEARYRASFATLDATTEAGRASHSVSHFKLPSRLARRADCTCMQYFVSHVPGRVKCVQRAWCCFEC